MNRREVLTAAPAAGFATMMMGVAPAQADSETPVMMLFRDWQEALAEMERAFERDEPELISDAYSDARHQIELRMLREPALTPLDLVAKFAAWTSYGQVVFGDDDPRTEPVWAEVRAMIGGVT